MLATAHAGTPRLKSTRACVCLQDKGVGMQRQLTRKMQAVGLITEAEEEVREHSCYARGVCRAMPC